ncbi:MAG: hypothetical protein QG641_965 [Candidatus Poribacteria bacterium]|nr:hypothetical protein [Candidatus Poribacteria bacterium]
MKKFTTILFIFFITTFINIHAQDYSNGERVVQASDIAPDEFFPQIWDEQKLSLDQILCNTLHDIDKDGVNELVIAAVPQNEFNVQIAIYVRKDSDTYIKSWATFLTEDEEELLHPEELKIEFLDCNNDGHEEMIAELVSRFYDGAFAGEEIVAFYYSSGIQKRHILKILLKPSNGPISVEDVGRTIPREIHTFSRKVHYSDVEGDGDIFAECYIDDRKLHRQETYLWQDGVYLFDQSNLDEQVQELLNHAKNTEDDNHAINLLDKIQEEYYSFEPKADESLQLEVYFINAERYISSKRYEPAYKSLKRVLSFETAGQEPGSTSLSYIRENVPQANSLKDEALYEIGKLYEEQFYCYDNAISAYNDLLAKDYRVEEIKKRLENLEQKKDMSAYIPISKKMLGEMEPRFIKVIQKEILADLPMVQAVYWSADGKELVIFGDNYQTLRLSDKKYTERNLEEFARYLGDTQQILEKTMMEEDDNRVEDYLFSPDGRSATYITESGVRQWWYQLKFIHADENRADVIDITERATSGEIKCEAPEAISGDWITLIGWRDENQLVFGIGVPENDLPQTLKFTLYDANAKTIKPIKPDQIGSGKYSHLISPDGSKLAYFDDETGTLWIKNSDGSQPSILDYELENLDSGAPRVRWSPDSSNLVFTDGKQIVILTLIGEVYDEFTNEEQGNTY